MNFCRFPVWSLHHYLCSFPSSFKRKHIKSGWQLVREADESSFLIPSPFFSRLTVQLLSLFPSLVSSCWSITLLFNFNLGCLFILRLLSPLIHPYSAWRDSLLSALIPVALYEGEWSKTMEKSLMSKVLGFIKKVSVITEDLLVVHLEVVIVLVSRGSSGYWGGYTGPLRGFVDFLRFYISRRRFLRFSGLFRGCKGHGGGSTGSLGAVLVL